MNIGNYVFNGPYDPSKGFKNNFGAVYAILDDYNNVIDVGEAGNINDRFPNHDRKDCWPKHAHGNTQLFILLDSNIDKRLQIESGIRNQYNPPCGER